MDVRVVLSAHQNHLILQFSLSYFRLSLEYNILCVVYYYFFLLYNLCFIGNSNYFIINDVPKLVWGCSQAVELRHINKVFYSIPFYVNLQRRYCLEVSSRCFHYHFHRFLTADSCNTILLQSSCMPKHATPDRREQINQTARLPCKVWRPRRPGHFSLRTADVSPRS